MGGWLVKWNTVFSLEEYLLSVICNPSASIWSLSSEAFRKYTRPKHILCRDGHLLPLVRKMPHQMYFIQIYDSLQNDFFVRFIIRKHNSYLLIKIRKSSRTRFFELHHYDAEWAAHGIGRCFPHPSLIDPLLWDWPRRLNFRNRDTLQKIRGYTLA